MYVGGGGVGVGAGVGEGVGLGLGVGVGLGVGEGVGLGFDVVPPPLLVLDELPVVPGVAWLAAGALTFGVAVGVVPVTTGLVVPAVLPALV